MLVINAVEYSKNPVSVNQAFLIKVTVEEVFGTWNDIKTKTWANVEPANWQDLNLKIIPASYGLWGEQISKTWNSFSSKTWQDVRLEQK